MQADLIAQAADYSYGAIQAVVVPLVSALLGAVVGGALAGWGACWAVKKDYKLRTEREEKQARDELRAYYQSIQTEMKCFWEHYNDTYWPALRKVKDDNFLRVPMAERQLFTIYKASACMLGKLPNSNLRKEIVETYNKCEAVCAELLVYTKDLYEYFSRLHAAVVAGQDDTSGSFRAREGSLIEGTKLFKREIQRLEPIIKHLLEDLQQEIKSLT